MAYRESNSHVTDDDSLATCFILNTVDEFLATEDVNFTIATAYIVPSDK